MKWGVKKIPIEVTTGARTACISRKRKGVMYPLRHRGSLGQNGTTSTNQIIVFRGEWTETRRGVSPQGVEEARHIDASRTNAGCNECHDSQRRLPTA